MQHVHVLNTHGFRHIRKQFFLFPVEESNQLLCDLQAFWFSAECVCSLCKGCFTFEQNAIKDSYLESVF